MTGCRLYSLLRDYCRDNDTGKDCVNRTQCGRHFFKDFVVRTRVPPFTSFSRESQPAIGETSSLTYLVDD